VVGFVLAGFIALLGMDFFNALFVTDAPPVPRTLENVVVGPIIAVLSFVCSIGNVPLAAVLWAGGISFSGVVAFIFADLITLPIVMIYRKYYGTRFALKLVAIMFATMVLAAIVVDLAFAGLGVIPAHRPSIHSIADRGISFNYTAVLDIVFTLVFVALIGLTMRRGAKDPVCGMTVDSRAAQHVSEHAGRTYFFCSAHCRAEFESNPERYGGYTRAPLSAGSTLSP
jgi:YHS domain-containing protein